MPSKDGRASRNGRWEAVEHGTTYGMAQRCYRLNPSGGCCKPCRKVWTDYAARWREERPLLARAAKVKDNARQRALWRLARRYPAMFRALVEEENEKDRVKREAEES